MAYQTRETLKNYFKSYATPTAAQFANLVDSMVYVETIGDIPTEDGSYCIPIAYSATKLISFFGLAYNPDKCSFRGGENAIASGLSSVAFGSDSEAAGDFSMAGGVGSKARRRGEQAWASGHTNRIGDAQSVCLSLPINDQNGHTAIIEMQPDEVLSANCVYTDREGYGTFFSLLVRADGERITHYRSEMGRSFTTIHDETKVNDLHIEFSDFQLLIRPVIDDDSLPIGHLSIWGSSVLR